MGHKHKDRKKHKKEKSKKHRKEKKYKKKKQEYSSDSSNSSSSDSEKKIKKEKNEFSNKSEWNFLDSVLSDTNNLTKNKKEKKRPSPEGPGQNVRELNPYWKDGGCGLPMPKEEKEDNDMTRSPSTSSGFVGSSRESGNSKSFHDDKPSKPLFLKPGEYERESISLNKNTYQRNWKKRDSEHIQEEKTDHETISKNETPEPSKAMSDEDLNKLASKLVKAEIMGNTSLVNKLKAELEAAKKSKSQAGNEGVKGKSKEVVILTDQAVRGKHSGDKTSHVPSKKPKMNTHDSTGRLRYFPDDDKYSLQNLFEKEKRTSREEILLPTKISKNPDELDDVYLAAAASDKMQQKMEERENRKAMKEAVVKHKTLEGCSLCLENRKETKHLIVSTGNKCYLSLPEEESLTKGHCLIVPLQHEISGMHLDEDVWDEIKTYQRQLTKMFLEQDQDVVFFENARSFKHYPHCLIHCVPLDKEMGDVAPIYFQKAISESETEWSDNKKVIDFRNKDLRRSIPKGLPYFAVSFGTEGGFAHIIEDEFLFKKNFAEEVLGGMLDMDPRKWRKPQKENFRSQREKTLEFLKMWKKYEINQNSTDSDSNSSE